MPILGLKLGLVKFWYYPPIIFYLSQNSALLSEGFDQHSRRKTVFYFLEKAIYNDTP